MRTVPTVLMLSVQAVFTGNVNAACWELLIVFFGRSEFSRKCNVKQRKTYFFYKKEQDGVVILCTTPAARVNYYIGYFIKYYLDRI